MSKEDLYQIITNLVFNSINAVKDDDNPKIKIEVIKTESNILIEITDNGKGIPDHIKKEIFNPFFSTKENGTGLGLDIVKRIVEQYKGSINLVKSGHSGTTFEIILPVKEEDGNEEKDISY